jgi:hypothetical protein
VKLIRYSTRPELWAQSGNGNMDRHAFPGDGAYTFPAGLAPVQIDRQADTGTYWEPNVWIVHTVVNP